MANDITPGTQQIPSGEGARLIPDEFGLACDTYGRETLMRRMMRDPWLGFAFVLLTALVLEGEHRILPAVGDLPPDASASQRSDARMAQRFADELTDIVANLKRPFRRTLKYAMEAIPFGHKLAEVEWALQAGLLVFVDVAPKPRTNYDLHVDSANLLKFVRPKNAVDGASDVYPESIFIFSWDGRDDHPAGTPACERAYEAWYRKNCAKPVETKSLTVYAGGISWAEADKEAKPTVTRKDADGKEEQVYVTQIVAQESAKIKTGRVGAFPPGWTYKNLPPANSFGAFDSTYDRCDREMVTAFFVAARAVMEARFGSRADSNTAEGMVSSIRDWIRAELCEGVRKQLFAAYVRANYGEQYVRLAPIYAIETEERSELAAVTQAITAFISEGILTPDLADHLLSLIGIPEAIRRSVMAAVEKMNGNEPAPAKPQTFADDPQMPAVKTRPAKRADKGASKIVGQNDRKLRGLVAKWQNGDIDADAFVSQFSDQLTAGHESAAKLGAQLAGYTGDTLPVDVREYLAATIGNETEFLQELVDDVSAGAKSPAQARLAARRYAQRMSGTVSAAFHEASPRGSKWWWQLGAAEHCEDCPRLESMSPFDHDELLTRPREGETQCMQGCKCRLVRGDGVAGPGPTPLAGYDDSDDSQKPSKASDAPTEPVLLGTPAKRAPGFPIPPEKK